MDNNRVLLQTVPCMSRQVDHLGQDEVQGQGQDRFKPVTWKVQGVVLQFHIVPKGNLAAESVRSHFVSCENARLVMVLGNPADEMVACGDG